MRKFKDPATFGLHLLGLSGKLAEAMHADLDKLAKSLAKDAQGMIGHYQRSDMGPFPGWAELADSTKADRLKKGFTENDPLERTDHLKDSIEGAAEGFTLVVGSDSKIAVYQELGTNKIPPRPFLSLALVRGEKKIKETLAVTLAATLAGVPKSRLKSTEE